MSVITMDQIVEAAMEMKIGDRKTFTLDEEPETFFSDKLCALINIREIRERKTRPSSERSFSIKEEERTISVHCYCS